MQFGASFRCTGLAENSTTGEFARLVGCTLLGVRLQRTRPGHANRRVFLARNV
jgi:hypothetical protein